MVKERRLRQQGSSVVAGREGGNKSSVLKFAAKLRHCRTMMKRWCASHFYSIRKEKKLIEVEIQELNRIEERLVLTPNQFERRQGLRDKLTRVLDDEELLWRTRAKKNWLKEGDLNTKFFHAFANGRKWANCIGVLEEDGRVFSREGEKKSYFARKLYELFSTSEPEEKSVGD